MRITLIAAIDQHMAIGRGGQLPWRLPDDLQRFKALTLGKTVLMGRKTAESLGRALPGRTNLVLTRGATAPFSGMQAVATLAEAQAMAGSELVVIGGGEIYALTLPLATHLQLTRVAHSVEDADAFFPAFAESEWRLLAHTPHPADARHRHAFEFLDLQRRTPSD